MKACKRITYIVIFAVLCMTGCDGTSTSEYLNGEFIDYLNDTTPPDAILPVAGEKVFNGTAVLQWTSKKGALFYTVEVTQDVSSDFTAQIPGSPFTVFAPDTVLSLDLPVESSTYCWRVRANITLPGQYGQSSFEAMDDSVYVYCPADVSEPDDAGMAGNISKPYQRILRGIAEADRLNLDTVKVAARGNTTDGFLPYNELVVLKDGINLFGGYTSLFTEAGRDSSVNTTIIKGEHGLTVKAKDIVLATVFDGFTVQGQDDGVDTYSVYVDSCYYDFTISNCDIIGAVTDAEGIDSYGLYLVDSPVNIVDNVINGGELSGSGWSLCYSIAVYQSNAVIQNNNIIGGIASDTTYGVYISDGSPVLTMNTINGPDSARNYYGIYAEGSNPEITDNEIAGGAEASLSSIGIGFNGSDGSLVLNNIISGNDAESASYGVLVINSGSQHDKFINNLISSGVSPSTFGFSIVNSNPLVLCNSIIGGEAADEPGSVSCGMRINDDSYHPIVIDNIIVSIETSDERYGIDGLAAEHLYNCYWSGGGTDYNGFSLHTGEVAVNPNFTEEYRLKALSPDSVQFGGIDLSVLFGVYPYDTDLDGNPRTTGSGDTGWSMGAYECDLTLIPMP